MSSGLKWAGSLTRIANYEVETLQKRLGEVVERRLDAELRITLMDAEAEAEMENANADPMSAMYHPQFLMGWRVRRQQLDERMAQIAAEEQGARDALSRAFEELNKYEHVLEVSKTAANKETARRETLALDELGLRAASR